MKMKGTIKLYNINSQNGTILGYDAKKYMFSKDDFLQEINIKLKLNKRIDTFLHFIAVKSKKMITIKVNHKKSHTYQRIPPPRDDTSWEEKHF